MLTHDMCLIMFTLIAKNCNLTDILENKTGAQVGSQDRFQYIIKKDFFNSLSSLKNKLQLHEAITFLSLDIFKYKFSPIMHSENYIICIPHGGVQIKLYHIYIYITQLSSAGINASGYRVTVVD